MTVDQMKHSQITTARGKPGKSIRETIKKDLEINELDRNMVVYDRILWHNLIHVADSG
jgi:hypothetical protein